VQAKQQELIQLQAENEKLKSRARVLETAERCSSEIHELMQLLDGLQVGGTHVTQSGCSLYAVPTVVHCCFFVTPVILLTTYASAAPGGKLLQHSRSMPQDQAGVGWVQDAEYISACCQWKAAPDTATMSCKQIGSLASKIGLNADCAF